jgi:hypothetical protein
MCYVDRIICAKLLRLLLVELVMMTQCLLFVLQMWKAQWW